MGLSRTFTGGGTRMRCSSPAIIVPPMFMLYAARPTGGRYVQAGWGNPSLDNNFVTAGNDSGATPAGVYRSRVRSSSANTAVGQTAEVVPQEDWGVFFSGHDHAALHYTAFNSLDTLVLDTTNIAVWPTLTTIFVGTSDEASGNESGMQGQVAWLAILDRLPPLEHLEAVLRGAPPLELISLCMRHFWRFEGDAAEPDLIGSAPMAVQLGTPAESDHYPDPVRIDPEDIKIASKVRKAVARRRARVRVSKDNAFVADVRVDLNESRPTVVRVARSGNEVNVRSDRNARQKVTMAAAANPQVGAVVLGAPIADGAPQSEASTRRLMGATAYATAATDDSATEAARIAAAAAILQPVISGASIAAILSAATDTFLDLSEDVTDPALAGWRITQIVSIAPVAAGSVLIDGDDENGHTIKFSPNGVLAEGATVAIVVALTSQHPSQPPPVNVTIAGTVTTLGYPNGFEAAIDYVIGRQVLAAAGEQVASMIVPLPLDDAWYKTVANGGKVRNASGFDIRVELLDGTVVPFQRREWSGSAGTGLLMLAMPVSIGPNADVPVVVYIGRPNLAQDQQAATSIYAATYLWVLDVLTGEDLTGRDRDLTVNGTWATAAGLYGLAASAGGSVYGTFEAFGEAVSGLSEISWEVVLKPAAIDNDKGVFAVGDTLTADSDVSAELRQDARGFNSEASLGITPYPNVWKSQNKHSGGGANMESIRDSVTTEWTTLLEGYRASEGPLRYQNGAPLAFAVGPSAISGATAWAGRLNVFRAALQASAGNWTGLLQELRLSARKPSAARAWILDRSARHTGTFWAKGRRRTPTDNLRLVAVPLETTAQASAAASDIDVLATPVFDATAAPPGISTSPAPSVTGGGSVAIASTPFTGNTASAGSTTTFFLPSSLAALTASQLVGRVATIGGNDRVISAYNGATRQVTVATAYPSAVGSGVAFSIAYSKLRFTPPTSAGTSKISYQIQDAGGRTASGTVQVNVRQPAQAIFAPALGRGMGGYVGGTNFTNIRLADTLRRTYSGLAPLTALLMETQFQIASNQTASGSSEAAPNAGNKKSAGTGDWHFELAHRLGTTTKLAGDNANVQNRPGTVIARQSRTHYLGTPAQAGYDGSIGGDMRRAHRCPLFTQPRGAARAGSKSTLRLASNASAVNGHYVGGYCKIVSGPGAGQGSWIVGYVGGTTQEIQFSPELVVAAGQGSVYRIGYPTIANDTVIHNTIRNEETSPSTKWASVNTLALRTGSTDNYIPLGLNPPRRFGPLHEDGQPRFFMLTQTSSGAEGSDPYRWVNDFYGCFCWIYDVDGEDFYWGQAYEYTGSPEPRWNSYVGGNNRLRVRFRHCLGTKTFRYLSVYGGWMTRAAFPSEYSANKWGRPTSPLVMTLYNETDGGSVSASLSPVASPANVSDDPTDINGWAAQPNDNSTWWDWNRFDFGSTAVELRDDKIYRLEATNADGNHWYYLPGHQDANIPYQNYDSPTVIESGVYNLHSGLGYLNHWREAASAAKGSNKPAYMEQSLNGGTSWAGMKLFSTTNRDDVIMPAWFHWL